MADIVYIPVEVDMVELGQYQTIAMQGNLHLDVEIVAEYDGYVECEVTGDPEAVSSFITLWEGAH